MFQPIRILSLVAMNRALRVLDERIDALMTKPVAPITPEEPAFDVEGCENLVALKAYADTIGVQYSAQSTLKSLKTKIQNEKE